jgi:hypothetical protein
MVVNNVAAKVEKVVEESPDEGETTVRVEEDSMEVGGDESLLESSPNQPSARKQWTTLVNSDGVSFANNVLATSKLTQPKKQAGPFFLFYFNCINFFTFLF